MGFFKPNIKKMQEQLDIAGIAQALTDNREDVQKEAIDALFQIASGNSDIKIRNLAKSAIYSTFEFKRIYLMNNIKEKTTDIEFLTEIRSFLISLLDSPDYYVRADAATSLIQFGESAVEPLINALIQTTALIQNAQFMGSVPNKDPRKYIVDALGKIKDVRAVEPLMLTIIKMDELTDAIFFMMGTNKTQYREYVANALGNIGNSAIDILAYFLNDSSDSVCQCAAMALGKIKNPHAVDKLINALNHKNHRTRIFAAQNLGKAEDKRAINHLIKTLNDEEEWVRAAASNALGYYKEKDSLEALKRMDQDQSEYVRKSASEAIDKINGK